MIAVFGSLNMDFVVRVERLPSPGETVLGSDFAMLPGGKGANQAYAAARLGASVRMIGAVGADSVGTRLKDNLRSAGVDVSRVRELGGEASGVALISVDAEGQNSIVVSSGANGRVTVPDAEAFHGVSLALFQLESPLSSVEEALRLARKAGATTILDPAPAQPLTPELLQLVDILTPNETEAASLSGDLSQLAAVVVLKLGAAGCRVFRDGQSKDYPGFSVDAVDTTAAGDTFNAALACALDERQPFDGAIRFAHAAAALSVMRSGAQSSAPTRDEVEQFLKRN